ncbi:MAG TPA: hypothetical protein VG815_22330 [Chloroflexota bacterium]|jgi:hypothetical protein|nr:hypothetical protein [Chloroflexota bacterium]
MSLTRRKLALIAGIALLAASVSSLPVAFGQGRSSGSTIPPDTLVFGHGSATVGQMTLTSSQTIDLTWRGKACADGIESPPVVVTWGGPTNKGLGVPETAAPILAHCHGATKAARRDAPITWDVCISISPPGVWFTYRGFGGTPCEGSAVANQYGAEDANVFLTKGSFLSGIVGGGGSPPHKVKVPAGANTLHWYGKQGG